MNVTNILHKGEKIFDRTKIRIKKRYDLFEPIIIYPYYGYANDQKVHIQGRVIEQEGILDTDKAPESIRKKLWYMFRRYESDEVPHAEVEVVLMDKTFHIKANEEGFIDEYLPLPKPFPAKEGNWHKIHLRIIQNVFTDQKNIHAEADIMVPDKKTKFGIISDVDDTIVHSFATNTYLKFKTLLLKNAKGRVPFKGVEEFYKKLQTAHESFNPLFFVSGSTWNVFDLLKRFCLFHDIPRAPFFLREFGLNSNFIIQRKTRVFKKEKIRHLFSFYPELSFICIGDSGQHDPEIYTDMAEKFPGRIKAIYIRKVNDKKISKKRQVLKDRLKKQDIPILFIHDTSEALNHARKNNYISA